MNKADNRNSTYWRIIYPLVACNLLHEWLTSMRNSRFHAYRASWCMTKPRTERYLTLSGIHDFVLFKTAEEIEQEIADIKNALFDFDTENAKVFCSQISQIEDKKTASSLKKALQTLLAAGFATQTPWAQWPRLPIYLKAMTLRLEKYSSNPARDAAREADIQELEQMWQEKTDGLVKQGQPVSDDLAAFKWMIEELRVSLFAQELKTPYPVSVKRLMKEWEGI